MFEYGGYTCCRDRDSIRAHTGRFSLRLLKFVVEFNVRFLQQFVVKFIGNSVFVEFEPADSASQQLFIVKFQFVERVAFIVEQFVIEFQLESGDAVVVDGLF